MSTDIVGKVLRAGTQNLVSNLVYTILLICLYTRKRKKKERKKKGGIKHQIKVFDEV